MTDPQDENPDRRGRRSGQPGVEPDDAHGVSGFAVIGAPEDYLNTLGDEIQGRGGALAAINSTFTNIERAFQRGDMDAVQQQFERVPDGAKAIVAKYIHDRAEAGEPLNRDAYKAAVYQLIDDDVAGARAFVNGEVAVSVAPAPALKDENAAEIQPGAGEPKALPGAVDNAAIAAQMSVEILKGNLKFYNSMSGTLPEGSDLDAQKLGVSQDEFDAAMTDPCVSLAAYGPVKYALQAVEANFAGVVSGDFQDLSTISVDFNKIPDAARSVLAEELETLESNLERAQALGAQCKTPAP